MKYIFIVNPGAGRGRCQKLIPKIEEECKKRNRDFEIRYISNEQSGYDIAMEYKNQENVIVFFDMIPILLYFHLMFVMLLIEIVIFLLLLIFVLISFIFIILFCLFVYLFNFFCSSL